MKQGDHNEVAEASNDFERRYLQATRYCFSGEYEKALQVYEDLYESRRDALGEEREEALKALGMAARISPLVGDINKTFFWQKKSYEEHRKCYGKEDERTRRECCNLADTYHDFYLVDQDRELREELYDICRTLYGEENEETLFALENLAEACENCGDYDRELELIEKKLALLRRKLGEEDPETIATLALLARVMRFLGESEQEKRLRAKVDALCEKAFDSNNPDDLEQKADIYVTLCDHKQALEINRGRYRLLWERVGSDDDQTMVALFETAKNYLFLGRPKKALKLLQDLYAEQAKSIRIGIVDATDTWLLIASIYRDDLGDDRRALDAYTKAREIACQLYGKGHRERRIELEILALKAKLGE